MSITKTIHPPAGATALLAATSPEITRLGWYLLPLVLLGSTLMLVSACLINNIHRQFPIYWWTPVELGPETHGSASSGIERLSQAEREVKSGPGAGLPSTVTTRQAMHLDHEHELRITAMAITIPDWLEIDDWERNVLEILRTRLTEGMNETDRWLESGQLSFEQTQASTR